MEAGRRAAETRRAKKADQERLLAELQAKKAELWPPDVRRMDHDDVDVGTTTEGDQKIYVASQRKSAAQPTTLGGHS